MDPLALFEKYLTAKQYYAVLDPARLDIPGLDLLPLSEEAQATYSRILARLEKSRRECLQIMKRAEDLAASLPEKEADVMRAHYFQGIRWEDIADGLFYSQGEVYRIRKKALASLDKWKARLKAAAEADGSGAENSPASC